METASNRLNGVADPEKATLPSTPVLSIRKARKADEKIRADKIARSKATMARQAIKASATATRIPDEIAARNSERSSERK